MSVKSGSGREENKLTQCFDDILRISAELLTQQQLKTIKVQDKITNGYSMGQQRLLQERVSQFNSMLDSLDVSLQTTVDYVGAVMESAMDVKRKRDAEEKEKREKQERLEKEKQERQRQEEERLSAKNTPMDMLANFETDIPGSGGTGGKGFGAEFRDLNGMDLSMFDTMDGQGSFGGLQSGGNVGVGVRSDGVNVSSSGGNANNQTSDVQRSNAVGIGGNNGLIENKEPQSNFNDTNAAPSSIAVPESGPDSYLTLNDFNDLGIDWNTTNDINDLNLEDFNL